MSLDNAEQLLQERFKQPLEQYQSRRIIFWYDVEGSFSEEIDQYKLPEVRIIKVDRHNYFKTKYQIEFLEPNQNFLLYFMTARPDTQHDPLIDIYLYSQPEFRTDRISQVFDELDVQSEEMKKHIIHEYPSFFNNQKRQSDLVDRLRDERAISQDKIELAIFLVLIKEKEFSFLSGLMTLLGQQALEDLSGWQKIERFGRPEWFWQQVEKRFGFHDEVPTVAKLMIAIFETQAQIEFESGLPRSWQKYYLPKTNDVTVFLNQWANQRQRTTIYEKSIDYITHLLKLDRVLENKPIDFLKKGQLFAIGDALLVQVITTQLVQDGLNLDAYEQTIVERQATHWYSKYKTEYRILLIALRLIRAIDLLAIQSEWHQKGKAELWHYYQTHLAQIDRWYRQFNQCYSDLKQPSTVLGELRDKINRYYSNGFLVLVNQQWYQKIQTQSTDQFSDDLPISQFYKQKVAPLVAENKRVFIIISDAFRYEVGQELVEKLNRSQRFDATLDAMEGSVPSYTDLGMASLLPHQKLTLDGEGHVLVDQRISSGLKNRLTILQNALPNEAVTVNSAEDVLKMSRDQLRQLYNGTTVNYIYHNIIDARGDNAKTESEIFSAVDLALSQLSELVSALVGHLTATNIFITADHGFIFEQYMPQSIDKVVSPTQYLVRNRRFWLDQQSTIEEPLLTFKPHSLPDYYAHTPRGLERLAIQGGGSRYIHGGASLQELMIPLIAIKNDRHAQPVKQVDLALLNEFTIISSYQFSLSFIQIQAISSSRRSKEVIVYVENKDGYLISNKLTLIADYRQDSSNNRVLTGNIIIQSSLNERYQPAKIIIENIIDPNDRQEISVILDLPEID
ncbi:BREX-1 system phosphatase PglZ type A [Latilactobacillus sakei]|uniref:BREX-1 system phosphatase PglZ type A n=1 Tax=Latilactobacillus sakei TaxID=1599 RepID=UPI000C13B116|nr:BREX-1 system phosphatase PglZ type A [Latilactobacillus sakei]SOB41215.1 putative PglZ domain protein [Latilactobacillus sakei]